LSQPVGCPDTGVSALQASYHAERKPSTRPSTPIYLPQVHYTLVECRPRAAGPGPV